MSKKAFLSTILFAATSLIYNSNAQSIVDPGVSVHNYKHPNKAAQAKAKRTNTVAVYNLKTIESYSKQQHRYASSTPKYAPRPVTLVVTKKYNVEGIEINPLLSPRNYKTPTNMGSNNKSQVADIYDSTSKSVYPTVD
ncbi:hypothetical protein [Dyadobacter sp. CY326]|uniref:hypothetical protein n=1 Tax=Dyadobacter sp. CY326 TaxID=2907300 RepID=UPI001F3ACC31|nr:hypothetical protein [Dyadobacter sp. CY326]MCE7064657.1 hypothetical protein [Dyadobacter sp. CY326]